ncbi:MAG: Ig-like domain-containing protein, partial [Nitrosomonas sp.]|nr:Ig-like domain-containing protein [Nitrosomonas sp.]
TKLANGNYSLTAHAFDAAGNQGVSGSVSIAVSNAVANTQAPVISIASPATGSTVSGILSVTFSFSEIAAIRYVDLYVNGIPYSRKSVAPFTHTLNTGLLPDGNHILTAHAFDIAGNHSVSANVSVTVSNAPTADTQKPVISIASPAAGSTVSGILSISFNYTDNVAVKHVDLYVNGIPYSRKSTAPFTHTLNTKLLPDGSHTLTAHAFDAAGNHGVSANLIVKVKNQQ